MAGQGLSGPGIGLAYPQNYYPSELQNAAQDPSSNRITLNQGDTFVVPAGDFFIGLGAYLVLRFLDPVTNTWVMASGTAFNRGVAFVTSDGYNVQIANLTGCVVGASITNAGSSYVQGSTTITASGAGFQTGVAVPTFAPIIGGQLGLTGTFTIDVPTKGAGYGIAPIVMIPPPPPAQSNANGVGGVPATAYAVLGASGSIAAISLTNPGAGYPVAPAVTVVPSPFDPNLSLGITAASVSFSLTGSGSITGVLLTNNGGPLINGSLANVTLALGGAGSSGSLTAIVMQTVISSSVSGPGVGYGTGEVPVMAVNGGPPAGAIATNPEGLRLAWISRPAQLGLTGANTSVSVGSTLVVYDGGLFEGTPTLLVAPATGLAAPSTVATIAVVMGGRPDVAIIQAAP
jgi:hypothetical protein